MRLHVLALLCALAPSGGWAQASGDSLAEIEASLSGLEAQLSALRSELQASGAAASGIVNAAPLVERVQQAETEIERLTGEVEKLRFRVEKVVADGTNRIDDLKFRLTELEGGDLGALAPTPELGTQDPPPAAARGPEAGGSVTGSLRPRLRGGEPAAGLSTGFQPATPAPIPAPNPSPTPSPSTPQPSAEPPVPAPPAATPALPEEEDVPELAIAEREAFEKATAALDAGDAAGAAILFETFLSSYPGGPLTAEAQFLRGEALTRSGDVVNATRAYLDAFTAAPEGSNAPIALLNVARSLGRLGRVEQACATLAEVSARYPAAPIDVSSGVAAERQELGCP